MKIRLRKMNADLESNKLDSQEKTKSSVSQNLKFAALGGLVVLVLVGAAGSAYYYGVVQTRKETISDTLQKLVDPTAILNVPENITGKVSAIGSDSISVEGRDKSETIRVSADVPITLKGQTVTLEEIQNNDTATVLYQSVEGELQATRILVR